MTTNRLDGTLNDPVGDPRQNRRRTLQVVPVLLLLGAGLAALLATPAAWGAASVIDIPAWMPSFIGLIVAVSTLFIALSGLRSILRATRGDFEVHGIQAAGGVLLLLAVSGIVFGFATRLPDPDQYRSGLNDDGEIVVGPAMFLVSGIILSVIYAFLAWLGAFLYSHAFANMQPNRISRRLPGEVDGVGEILRERQ